MHFWWTWTERDRERGRKEEAYKLLVDVMKNGTARSNNSCHQLSEHAWTVIYHRRAEQCCCHEVGPGGMVPWIRCLQGAGVMFQLHQLPIPATADQVWTNQEDGGQVWSAEFGINNFLLCVHVCSMSHECSIEMWLMVMTYQILSLNCKVERIILFLIKIPFC